MILVHPNFDPVALQIGPVGIHWYGLMYVLAFTFALVLGRMRIRKQEWISLTYKDLDDILFFGVIGVIVGGRLGYVLFYKPIEYFHNPFHIFYVWEGGMSFHGGLLGVILAMVVFCLRRKKNWLEVTDFVAPLVPAGLGAGRIGNFINGELWGRITDAPFGIIFPLVDDNPRHPSQLYEFFLEGVAFFVILWFFSRVQRSVGIISGMFLLIYGFVRFLVEFAREPDPFLGVLYLNLTMGQWLSLPMIVFGLLLIYFPQFWRK